MPKPGPVLSDSKRSGKNSEVCIQLIISNKGDDMHNISPSISLFWSCTEVKEVNNQPISVTLSDDKIFVGLQDGTVVILDYKDGFRCVDSFVAHEKSVKCVENFDRSIITGSDDKTIKVWDKINSHSTALIEKLDVQIRALLKFDRFLFSSSTDSSIIGLDSEKKWSKIFTLSGHTRAVQCLAKMGPMLLSGSTDESIKMWDAQTGFKCVRTFHEHTKTVTKVLPQDENVFLSGSSDCMVRVWDVRCDKSIRTLVGHNHFISSLIKVSDYVVSASLEGKIMFWDKDWQCLQSSEISGENVKFLLPIDDFFLSGSSDKIIRQWKRVLFT